MALPALLCRTLWFLTPRHHSSYGVLMDRAYHRVRYLADAGMGYLGQHAALRLELSPETETLIDREVRRLVEEAQKTALELLRAHEPALHRIAAELQEREVIAGEDVLRIVAEHQRQPA